MANRGVGEGLIISCYGMGYVSFFLARLLKVMTGWVLVL